MEHADLTPSSSYGVVRFHRSKRPKTQPCRDDGHDAELIVRAAFAPWAAHYRKTRPDMYGQVDRLRLQASRTPRNTQHMMLDYSGPVRECPRCGELFPALGNRPSRFCSLQCHDEHRDWCKRSGRRFYETRAA